VRLAVTSMELAQLCAAPREGATEVGNVLTRHCQSLMADYGVKVKYARFSDLAPVRAFSIMGLPAPAAKASVEGAAQE
jgi:hypothetical protein